MDGEVMTTKGRMTAGSPSASSLRMSMTSGEREGMIRALALEGDHGGDGVDDGVDVLKEWGQSKTRLIQQSSHNGF